ncbi:MAG: UDP-N-acetylmuramate:L-alanyl-gamma-D-glutamyl-meso-diaminopimelate ligase [Holophagales bacterium]|nr:UDP-N-acetylmuramate:L-alanyl-gamma-D-glutamyl-meso-diaminopimelate ligase [Holophagales bacterium]
MSRTFYLIAIGGTAMTPLAALLVEKGDRVLGSDLPLYPPMSDRLAALGIEVLPGFDARNLPGGVDRVVVGNLAGKDNPELLAALSLGLPVASMPQTLRTEFLAGRHPVVIAGTHGKTTTTALTAWLLAAAGQAPGYLVAGEPRNFPSPSAGGSGPAFVIEGDEYSTSWEDKGPKFLHYAPETFVVTSVEFDHADLYADLDAVKAAFRAGVALVPPGGRVVACGDDPNVRDVLSPARARVVLYGLGAGGDLDFFADGIEEGPEGTRFTVHPRGRAPFPVLSPLAGRHNVANTLAALAAGESLGLSAERLATGLPSFLGVKRRLEVRATAAGVTVVDDFAHHPTAVATTLAGARKRWPGRRIWGVFEPRSLTAGRADFLEPYFAALGEADAVAIAAPYHAARLSRPGAPGALDVPVLVDRLAAEGREAFSAPDPAALAEALLPRLAEGDVVIVMSSGAFGGLCGRLVQELSTRESASA